MLTGQAHKFGDDVSTDHIISGRYARLRSNLPELARHVLEDVDPTFADRVKPGDFIVAGRNFGLDHWQVAPDIITAAKGLAAGYAPLAAVIVSDRIVRAIREGSGAHTQGFTYSGNPLSCAAGLAVLRHLEDHDLVRQADRRGRHLGARLQELGDIPIVGDVRGVGMFHGV